MHGSNRAQCFSLKTISENIVKRWRNKKLARAFLRHYEQSLSFGGVNAAR